MGFAWNKLFRTNVIKSNNIRFKEKVIINEDVLFVCEYMPQMTGENPSS